MGGIEGLYTALIRLALPNRVLAEEVVIEQPQHEPQPSVIR